MSADSPQMETGMTTRVLEVIFLSTSLRSKVQISGSTSAIIEMALANKAAPAVIKTVNAGTITSSPSPISEA